MHVALVITNVYIRFDFRGTTGWRPFFIGRVFVFLFIGISPILIGFH